MELSSTRKINKTFLYMLEITWPMLLDRGLYWFDYPNFVQVESSVTLMPLGGTIEPTLWDDNSSKMYDQKPDTVRYSKCCQISNQ